MDCYVCLSYSPDIPLLRCQHYLCNVCYCNHKSSGIYTCQLCDKKLVRGTKKNKK